MSRKPKHDGLAPVQFASSVSKGEIDPVYLFVGPERFLRREAIARLIETVDEGFRSFNVDTFSASESDLERILDVARQLPMMAHHRLVVVQHAEAIKDTAQDALEDYLRAPCDQSVVVFAADALDMRRKSASALTKGATVVSFATLAEAEAMRWVEARVRGRECRIDPNALGALVDLVGTDLEKLAIEIDKLTTHAGRGQIGLAAVKALVPRAREEAVWDFTDAVAARDRKRALRVLGRQLDDGEEPLALLGMLASMYRKMLVAKELMQRHAPAAEVQTAVKLPPWKMGEFNAQVRRMPAERIVFGVRRIAEVDLAIKSSLGVPRLQLEILVCELTAGA
jgi:DNA polymerase III subunit delta